MSNNLYKELEVIFDKYNFKIPRNTKGIDKEKLLIFISKNLPIRRGALGYSSSGWSAFQKKVFPTKNNTQKLLLWLLSLEQKSYCPNCEKVKNITHFWKNKNRTSGINGYCSDCLSTYEHLYQARHAKKRAQKLKAMPSWASVSEIHSFYNNCPKGYHVDHIIPLQGKYVCGLHILNNLQYLPAYKNLIKNNYHESEEYWK